MKPGGIALVLSAVALGVAVFGLTRERTAQPQRTPVRTDRVAALETDVAELRREVASLKAARPPRSARDPFRPPVGTPDPDVGDVGGSSGNAIAEDDPELAAIVDDAVDRKTKKVLDELRVKENKKPGIDVFASMLELTPEQRETTERVVVDGQRQVHAILNTPAADGTNLMDALVVIAAKGIAQPGQDHGWGRWVARILSEKVPGTDVTYAMRIEAVKESMRATFKREWTEDQYREFQAWGVDPTEIEKVPGSPNEALFQRIHEHARRLGAEIPGDR